MGLCTVTYSVEVEHLLDLVQHFLGTKSKLLACCFILEGYDFIAHASTSSKALRLFKSGRHRRTDVIFLLCDSLSLDYQQVFSP